jgi:hypothetical protein
MEPREAFKFGFLARCAEEGLTDPEIQDRIKIAAMRKQAIPSIGGLLSGGLDLATGLYGAGAITAAGLGAGTGIPLGYAAAKLQDPGYDADAIKRQELMTAYGTLTDELDEQRRADKELEESDQPTAG